MNTKNNTNQDQGAAIPFFSLHGGPNFGQLFFQLSAFFAGCDFKPHLSTINGHHGFQQFNHLQRLDKYAKQQLGF